MLAALGLVLLLPLGAVLGVVFLREAPATVVQAVLAFGAADLVYLISEELMTEAHRGPEPKAAAVLVFAGFLSVFAFTLFGGGA